MTPKNSGWALTNAFLASRRLATVASHDSASNPPATLSKLTNEPVSGITFMNASSAKMHNPIVRSAITIVTNALVPLNRGGLRANVAFTTGLEYTF